MVFPDDNYITFSIGASSGNIDFSFPKKKPKKIFFDFAANDANIRMSVNDSKSNVLLHGTRSDHYSISFPQTVDKLTFTSSNETVFYLSVLIEEYKN